MPLSLTAADLLAPKGDLEYDWYAPLDSVAVSQRVNSSLVEGYAKTDAAATEDVRNDAAKAYAYYKEYKRIASGLARAPKTFTVNESSDTTTRQHSIEDAEFFLGLAQSWWDIFVAFVPVPGGEGDFMPSVSVKHHIRF